jgi:hypothetical protein
MSANKLDSSGVANEATCAVAAAGSQNTTSPTCKQRHRLFKQHTALDIPADEDFTWEAVIKLGTVAKKELVGSIMTQKSVGATVAALKVGQDGNITFTYQKEQDQVSASMSSRDSFPCIDGSLDSICETEWEPSPWFQLDLGNVQHIKEVHIYNRKDARYQDRFGYHEIWLSNDTSTPYSHRCFMGTAPSTGVGPFNQPCLGVGRYIRLVLPGEERTLEVAEIEPVFQGGRLYFLACSHSSYL